MNEYLKLLILSYFKQYPDSYSYNDIMYRFGIIADTLNEIMNDLVNTGCLEYINNLLKLTAKGRLKLMNTVAEYYDFSVEEIRLDKISLDDAWPIDKPYAPKDFLKKL